MQIVFWVSFGILFYIFFGYPILIWTLSTIVERVASARKPGEDLDNKLRGDDQLPTVTLIIAAYNEAKIIKEKIYNTFEIDYPKNKLQVIVFSDASTDHTDAIVKSFSGRGIEFFRIEGRVGKTECQNQVIKHATGDIVIFSDANSMYDPQAIKHLVYHFRDEKIGCVVGELRYVKNGTSDEGLYWKLEQFLKRGESCIDSCLGANGSIYAIRKNLYVPLPADAISDFIEPFKIYEQGYRVVYESDAFCTETVGDSSTEFARKQRIITRTLSSLKYITPFLNPLRYRWYSISLWSHKILRWFAFIAMISCFIATISLIHKPFFALLLVVQVIFYLAPFLGNYYSFRVFHIPYYFVMLQYMSLLAIINFFRNKNSIIWQPLR
jgi:cellulose synthase/poly-beta-1,6-N-acetylglucosamine synthase-like glycosyltransferase